MRQGRIARMPWLGQAMLLRKTPIGFVHGEPVYPICGSDGEGDGTGDGDGDKGASGSGSGSDSDDDDDEGEAGEKPPKDPKQYQAWLKNQQLSRENASRRAKNKELAEKLAAQQKELDDIKAKDMSDLQKAQTAATKAEQERDELKSRVEGMQVELAFLKMPRDKHDWHDPGAALTLLMAEHRDALTLEDDGSVTGLDQAVKDLAKKHKYLLKAPVTNNGTGGTGSNVGGTNGNGGGGNQKEDALKRFRI